MEEEDAEEFAMWLKAAEAALHDFLLGGHGGGHGGRGRGRN
jgi:hypothetical protein